jgi:hypothetical protein
MAEEENTKTSKILDDKDNNKKDRKKLKESFQTGKESKYTTITLFCKNKKLKHKNR